MNKLKKIKEVKYGKIPYAQLQDELAALMEVAIKEVENSTLPQQPDVKFWEDFILLLYK